MELKELIERAEKAAGSQKALGIMLGINPSNIRNAKAGQQGLPNYACVMIADLIGEEDTVVIAASELVTEKKIERRAFWEKKLEALAAGFAAFFVGVILVVTPTPSQAAQLSQVVDYKLYIM
ncbi:MAG: hypothetical protein HKM01_08435 [Gallionella sp.]|nr:hypothetical protein [Gallionella sp.]